MLAKNTMLANNTMSRAYRLQDTVGMVGAKTHPLLLLNQSITTNMKIELCTVIEKRQR